LEDGKIFLQLGGRSLDFKQRSVAAGIYAVRCAASGECRVGRAPDVSTIRNRLWFTLRQGSNPHRALQAAWREHGAAAFSFEVVERLDDEDVAYARRLDPTELIRGIALF
jgi:hypothetical protein